MKTKALPLLSILLLTILITSHQSLQAMANQGNEKEKTIKNEKTTKTQTAPSTTPPKNDELEAARAFIQAKEHLLKLQRQPLSPQKEIHHAQENLRRARIALQTALLHETTQDLTQNLERTGERAKELFQKTAQESNTILQDLLQQIEKIIPTDKPDAP